MQELNLAMKGHTGSQTLIRGLEVLEAVAAGATDLNALAAALDLNRSTMHRLAGTLVRRHYLKFSPRVGYTLGPKLLELDYHARARMNLPRVARKYIEALAASTGDTVFLGAIDGPHAYYLDKAPGSRRIEIASRIGERRPLHSSGLGKALILDENEARWRERYEYGTREKSLARASFNVWLCHMREHAKVGYTLDIEESEEFVRCVAAPVRDTADDIVGAICISSFTQYMTSQRMQSLGEKIRDVARRISLDMGWRNQSDQNLRIISVQGKSVTRGQSVRVKNAHAR